MYVWYLNYPSILSYHGSVNLHTHRPGRKELAALWQFGDLNCILRRKNSSFREKEWYFMGYGETHESAVQ